MKIETERLFTITNVKYEKKPAMTFIGYHTEIRPEEGYQNLFRRESAVTGL